MALERKNCRRAHVERLSTMQLREKKKKKKYKNNKIIKLLKLKFLIENYELSSHILYRFWQVKRYYSMYMNLKNRIFYQTL